MLDINHLAHILSKISTIELCDQRIKQIYSVLDYTCLTDEDPISCATSVLDTLHQLPYSVAALCLYPNALPYIKARLDSKPAPLLATVINFPHANTPIEQIESQLDDIIEIGLDEVDYVFPYPLFLSNEKQQAMRHLERVKDKCKNLTLKVILETGAFDNPQDIYMLSKDIIEAGANFIKTSTGKYPVGASLEAAYAILQAIKESNTEPSCAIKISGGINTALQAAQYIHMAEMMLDTSPLDKRLIRIGASRLTQDLARYVE